MNMPPPPPAERISLLKLATIFSITLVLAFGLCTASAVLGLGVNQDVASVFVWISIAIEGICLLGLLVIGAIAIIRALSRRKTI